jgi:hypothetical protein
MYLHYTILYLSLNIFQSFLPLNFFNILYVQKVICSDVICSVFLYVQTLYIQYLYVKIYTFRLYTLRRYTFRRYTFGCYTLCDYTFSRWICCYTKNKRKDSLRYTKNARKIEYLGKFETKIKILFRRLSRAQMGSFGQTTLNQNISCKCTFNAFTLLFAISS